MAAPIRSMIAPSLRSAYPKIASSRTCTANFASSSRIGLDFTRPRFAGPPPTATTTTLDNLVEDQPQSQPEMQNQASSSASSVRPPYPTPTPPSARPTIPTITPSFSNTRNTSTPLLNSSIRPTKRMEPRGKTETSLRYAPIQMLLDEKSSGDLAQIDPLERRRRVTHILHVRSTRNNVHLSFSDKLGNLWTTITAGSGGVFKKSNRSTYEAAHQAALKTFAKILDYSRDHQVHVSVAFRGLQGVAREAVAQAIQGPEGAEFSRLIVRVEDRTPIKIGGDRPRGKRNV